MSDVAGRRSNDGGGIVQTVALARVLIIEDDEDTRAGLEIRLRAAGYKVWGAASGAQGLALAGEHDPNVVVLDLGLPDTGGLSVLARMSVVAPNARVIVFSAWDAQRYEVEAMVAGAALYLEKPIGGDQVVAAVEGLLG